MKNIKSLDLEKKLKNGLKPCPFCGGKAHIRCILAFERPWFPECENERCIAGDTGVSFSTEEEAAEAWNRREK